MSEFLYRNERGQTDQGTQTRVVSFIPTREDGFASRTITRLPTSSRGRVERGESLAAKAAGPLFAFTRRRLVAEGSR